MAQQTSYDETFRIPRSFSRRFGNHNNNIKKRDDIYNNNDNINENDHDDVKHKTCCEEVIKEAPGTRNAASRVNIEQKSSEKEWLKRNKQKASRTRPIRRERKRGNKDSIYQCVNQTINPSIIQLNSKSIK